MDITYDPRYNIAYIRFRQKSKGVETRQISSEINIDISADGKIDHKVRHSAAHPSQIWRLRRDAWGT